MESSKPKIKLPKDIPVGTSKKESVVAWRLKGRKRALFYSTTAQKDAIRVLQKECNNYDDLINALKYDKTAQNIVRYFKDAGVPYDKF